MTVIATDTQRLSNVVKFEHKPELGYCRQVLEFDATNGAVAIGVLLGLNASNKWEKAIKTGTYTKLGVSVDGAVKLGGLVSAMAIYRGAASVSKAGLILDASYATTNDKNAVYATLEGQGIQVLDAF